MVNAANQAESPWQVHISNSANLTDESAPASFENALVLLKDETSGNTDTLFHTTNGHYGSDVLPLAGHEYGIEVQATGLETVSSNCHIPNLPKIDSIFAEWDQYLNDTVLAVDLQFQEEIGVTNYYLINVTATLFPDSSAATRQLAFIYTLDKNTDNFDLGDETTAFRYIYIDDKNIDENPYSTQFYIDLQEIRDQGIPYCLGISLQAVSEGLYLHLKSYEQYQDNNSGSVDFPLQVQVYGNILNGFGIFGGYAVKEKSICF